MSSYVKILKKGIFTVILFLIIQGSLISCADSYPSLSNSGVLSLIGATNSNTTTNAAQTTLYSFSQQMIVTSENRTVASVNIHLLEAPTSDVIMNFTSSDETEGSVLTPTLTFTPDNYTADQVLQIQGVDDTLMDGSVSYLINAAIVTSDSVFQSQSSFSVNALNTDNESNMIVPINAADLITTEAGATASFQVVLSSAPAANVTVGPILSDDSTEGSVTGEPLYLTFTPANWSTPQSVSVSGLYDSDTADQAYTISLGATSSTDPAWDGVTGPAVSVTNQDVLLEIRQSVGSAYLDEDGACARVSFVLTIPPAADVVLGPMESLDTTEATVSGQPLYLTFNSGNWSSPQDVYICGVFDSDTADQLFTADFGTSSSTDTKYDAISLGTMDFTNINTWPPAPAAVTGTLTVDGGYSGFSVASTKYVTFDVNAGTVYRVNWDDAGQGSGSYTADILAKLYYPDRSVIMNYTNHGYLSDFIFTASQTGTVYVELYPVYATGTVGVSVSTVTIPSNLLGNFEGVWDSFTGSGLWHISSVRAVNGSYSARFANDATGSNPFATFSTGTAVTGNLISPTFTAGTTVSFSYYLDGECSTGIVCTWDKLTVLISNNGGSSWIPLADLPDTAGLGMQLRLIDISGYTGQSVKLRFYFNSVDSTSNAYEGAYVDNILY